MATERTFSLSSTAAIIHQINVEITQYQKKEQNVFLVIFIY